MSFQWIKYLPDYYPPSDCKDLAALEDHCWWWNNVEAAIRDFLKDKHADALGEQLEECVDGYMHEWRRFEVSAFCYEIHIRNRKRKACDYKNPWLVLTYPNQIKLFRKWPALPQEVMHEKPRRISFRRITKSDFDKTISEKSMGLVYDRPNYTDLFLVKVDLNVVNDEILRAIKKEIIDPQRRIKRVVNPHGSHTRIHNPQPNSVDYNIYPDGPPEAIAAKIRPINWRLAELFDIQKRIGALDQSQRTQKSKLMKKYR